MPKKQKNPDPQPTPIEQIVESFSEKTNAAENFLRALDRLYRAFPDAEFSPETIEKAEHLRQFAASRTSAALREQLAENVSRLEVWMG